MARGKHAAQAARQRYETALEVVDRLNEKTSELKIRTRQVEALAKEAEPLRKRVAELERQLAGEETARLALLRATHEKQVAELEGLLDFAVEMCTNFFQRLVWEFSESAYGFVSESAYTDPRFMQLIESRGLLMARGFSRVMKRMLANRAFWTLDHTQDNLRARLKGKYGNVTYGKMRTPRVLQRESVGDMCRRCELLGSACATCRTLGRFDFPEQAQP